ncbi:MAG TPA: hypothetical protein PLB96_12815 [Syntrophales bacterium]|nr:hypothetical protein [Syntrophales bacterium]
MSGETRALADFASGLKFEAIDRRLVDCFKKYLLDAHAAEPDRAECIIDTVGRLERLSDIRELAGLLAR